MKQASDTKSAKVQIRWLLNEEIYQNLDLIQQLNPTVNLETLEKRLDDMLKNQFKCIGATLNEKIVGIAGVWIGFRFWCGKFIDIDNVVVSKNCRSLGIGKKLMDFANNYATDEACKISVLDAYTTNSKAHKFYLNEGYDIVGFHFMKSLLPNSDSIINADGPTQ